MAWKKRLFATIEGECLTINDALDIYQHAPLAMLMRAAHLVRLKKHPAREVSWIIDRNVNITNVCMSHCRFCNFCRKNSDEDAYITSINQYKEKIDVLYEQGGNQLLLQGGMHPDLGIDFYVDIFSHLKNLYPDLKLHALGPPEIVHIANIEKMTFKQVLQELQKAGLDSLPGAGAEILVDRVRKIVSPAKAMTNEWLEVMHQAHEIGLTTSATMMFGHVETIPERIEHLARIREVQDQKPPGEKGFISFIPWPFQDENTWLKLKGGVTNSSTAADYLRLIALSRLFLHNVDHIQASWLTVGKDIGQLCLYAGADDFGSVMIEENVVSSAGAHFQMGPEEMQSTICEAGFIPVKRNQQFEKQRNQH